MVFKYRGPVSVPSLSLLEWMVVAAAAGSRVDRIFRCRLRVPGPIEMAPAKVARRRDGRCPRSIRDSCVVPVAVRIRRKSL